MGIPAISLAVLLAGRAVLGGAESFMISGVLNWGLALAGPSNTGKVMSWVGTAMYIAFAAGAPAGNALYAHYGFVGAAIATAVVPLLTLLMVLPLDPVPPSAHRSNRRSAVRSGRRSRAVRARRQERVHPLDLLDGGGSPDRGHFRSALRDGSVQEGTPMAC
jgi:predicted MFS family arabinose efflux permease